MLEHMRWLGITADEDYNRIRTLIPRAGHYLFHDGRAVEYTEYEQEKGIFIDQEKYLNVENMPQELMTAEEVMNFCADHNVEVPFLADLLPLKRSYQGVKMIDVVNRSLRRIRPNVKLLSDPLNSCWYRERLNSAEPEEKRGLIIVNNIHGIQSSPSIIIDDGVAIVSPYGDLMLQTRDGYEFDNFEVWFTFQGTVFLLASTTIDTEEHDGAFYDCKYLFSLKDDCLTYLGKNPRRFENDVFSCSGGTFQMYDGRLLKLLDDGGYLNRDENRLVVYVPGMNGYFGGEQWIREETYYYLEKVEGVYQLVDSFHHM